MKSIHDMSSFSYRLKTRSTLRRPSTAALSGFHLFISLPMEPDEIPPKTFMSLEKDFCSAPVSGTSKSTGLTSEPFLPESVYWICFAFESLHSG